MSEYILDFTVISVFLYTSIILWKIARKKETKQLKLLLKTISIFILIHLIVFPLAYMILINQEANSIKIENNIIAFERNEKLEKAYQLRNEIDQKLIKKQKPELTNFYQKYINQLSKIDWKNIDDKRIIKIDSFMICGETRPLIRPGVFYKEIEIYNLSGFKQFEFIIESDRKNLADIFNNYLEKIESDRNRISQEIMEIKKNQFWNYRQILPYTLNILFTSNFNPQSRTANLIYFAHNILVVGFLMTLIMNLFQFYLLNNK